MGLLDKKNKNKTDAFISWKRLNVMVRKCYKEHPNWFFPNSIDNVENLIHNNKDLALSMFVDNTRGASKLFDSILDIPQYQVRMIRTVIPEPNSYNCQIDFEICREHVLTLKFEDINPDLIEALWKVYNLQYRWAESISSIASIGRYELN